MGLCLWLVFLYHMMTKDVHPKILVGGVETEVEEGRGQGRRNMIRQRQS